MADYGGEIDINGTGTALGQLVFYAPAGANSFYLSYSNGDNPITVSGMRGLPPAPSSQASGTNETYTIPNPEVGALVQYTGPMTLQWTWLTTEG